MVNDETKTVINETEKKPKKRGRKPLSEEAKKAKNYFSDKEEEAVVRYINSTSQKERDEIYMKYLYGPICKMIESIMRRYKLEVQGESYDETFMDTLSYLTLVLDKFKPSKNFKAYSYYGNIAKNYIIAKRMKVAKNMLRNPSYDSNDFDIDVTNDIKYANKTNKDAKVAGEIIKVMRGVVECMVADPEKYKLSPEETKIGKLLLLLFDKWDYIITTNGSNKLNKSAILNYLREESGYTTVNIRKYMKKYRFVYKKVKEYVIS